MLPKYRWSVDLSGYYPPTKPKYKFGQKVEAWDISRDRPSRKVLGMVIGFEYYSTAFEPWKRGTGWKYKILVTHTNNHELANELPYVTHIT